jgi:MFS transporter, FHS family, L-fucose permease
MSKTTTLTNALITVISVFFFWGFVASSNDILIPVFKKALQLSQTESQLISFCFYVAYTVGSLIYFIWSRLRGQDLLHSMGYRNGMSIGLVISAVGAALFYPAANTGSFPLLLAGLFIVGLGFSLQQTAANTIMIVLGDPSRSSQRLSLAGGINNIGTTIGPIIVAYAIFGSAAAPETVIDLEKVKMPYLILGAAFLVAAAVIKFSGIPDRIENATSTADGESEKASPFHYPQLVLGMIAIFLYVGVEVATASNLPAFMEQKLGLNESQVAPFVSLFWASLMMGRWTSAAGALGAGKQWQKILNIVLPYAAFGIFLGVNALAGHSIEPFLIYAPVVAIMIVVDILSGGIPARQLLYYSVMGSVALIAGIMASDPMVSSYAFISVGLFCSTLWPCIFTLGIHGLGRHTNEGASLLIMMIMGGGFVSVFQGYLSENVLDIQRSYWVGVLCFAYLAYYAWRMRHLRVEAAAEGH